MPLTGPVRLFDVCTGVGRGEVCEHVGGEVFLQGTKELEQSLPALPECPGTVGLSAVNTGLFVLRISGCLRPGHPFACSFKAALWFLKLLIRQ